MLELRPYQKEAVEAVYEHLRTCDDNPCVVLPTGTGKTLVIGQIVSDAVQQWSGRVLILAHVKELLEQNADKIRALCPGLDVGVYSAGLNSRDTDHSVIVAGIQSIYKRACELGPFDLVIVDECHLLAPDGEGMYRTFLADAKVVNPNLRIIGLTATPYRMKGGLICQPENLLNHVCYEAGLKEMINQGYLSPLISRAGKVEAKLDNLHVRGGEFIASEVEDIMDNKQLVDAACREIVSLTQERQSVLIFTSSVEHCQHVAEKIASYSRMECAIVTGSTSSGERAEILDRFKGKEVPADLFGSKPPLKFLANVNVLTTGFDATNTDCIVLLRPTNSPGLLVQMCLDSQTEILTEHGWRSVNTFKQIEKVAAFNMEKGSMEFLRAESVIKRQLIHGESMREVKAPHLDIRITNQHDIVYRNRHKKDSRWLKKTAEEMQKYRDSYFIPVAASGDSSGIDLSDDEVRFLGWVLTDGYMNPKTLGITISQSVESPYNADIISMLDGCNFGYGRYQIARKGMFAKYADNLNYHIPYGQPRGKNKNRTGWKKLFPFLTQRLLYSLQDISQKQLAILLEAMNYANGKKSKTITWTPKGYTLAVGNNELLADDLQAIIIQKGYRCNKAVQRQKTSWHSGEPVDQYLLYLKPQTHATIGGANSIPSYLVKNRCSITQSHDIPDELVWCVKNRLGTLVTRRNGKVAILGNCGRGTRLHPEKQNCLILDYGENIMRHGPVDMIQVNDKASGNGEAPAKKCLNCLALIHAAYMNCPECGYEFPPPEKSNINAHAEAAGVLSGQTSHFDYDVHTVEYSVHHKRGASDETPKTMRVEYCTGFNRYESEWVCPEHTGYARRKFEAWWSKRSKLTPPNNAAEAVQLAQDGVLAKTSKIIVKAVAGEKFVSVVDYEIGPVPDYCPEPGWGDPHEGPFEDYDEDEIPF